jgi:hypothetical protein
MMLKTYCPANTSIEVEARRYVEELRLNWGQY